MSTIIILFSANIDQIMERHFPFHNLICNINTRSPKCMFRCLQNNSNKLEFYIIIIFHLLENPMILITDKKITNIQEIIPILEEVMKNDNTFSYINRQFIC